MRDERPSSIINEQCRTDAVNEVCEKNPGITGNAVDFIKAVGKKFVEKQLERFPEICEIARVQNLIEWKNQRDNGNKGKYTDSYGWSKDRTFKFDYHIPQELYLFMQNMVYKEFWSEENERVWRRFMKRICDGENAYETLHKAKMKF